MGEGPGGRWSNNKNDPSAAGKTQDFLCLFCSFLFFFKTPSSQRFCTEFGQKCVLKKEHIKDHVLCLFFYLLCSFLLFLPDLVKKMSSNRRQKKNKKDHAAEKSQDVLRFCCWTPPPVSFLLLLELIFEHRFNVQGVQYPDAMIPRYIMTHLRDNVFPLTCGSWARMIGFLLLLIKIAKSPVAALDLCKLKFIQYHIIYDYKLPLHHGCWLSSTCPLGFPQPGAGQVVLCHGARRRQAAGGRSRSRGGRLRAEATLPGDRLRSQRAFLGHSRAPGVRRFLH